MAATLVEDSHGPLGLAGAVLAESDAGRRHDDAVGPPVVEAHRVVLSGLRRGTAYGYRVLSVDVAGNRRMSATGYVTAP